MKLTKTMLTVAVLLLGAIATSSALAHYRGYGYPNLRFGVYLGGPAYGYYPAPYYYPPYYYLRAVVAPSYPTEYVERYSAAAEPQRADPYWYFCPESNAYFPYVNQCPGGWQRVAPRPPAASGGTAP